MSGFAGGFLPVFLWSILPPEVGISIPLEWVSTWLLSAGMVAMGFRDLLGGGDDEENGEPSADDDFLAGDVGSSASGGLDEFDDGLGADDDPLAEIEPQLDDLEAELADVASTVSSVRGEHETMRESVEEMEENIRKLLEVYEVVTKGVNPFVDDPAPTAPSGGAFGLLDADEKAPPEAGDTADAEDLFPADTPDEPTEESDTSDGPDESASPKRTSSPDDDGLTFEDLKSEFDLVGDRDGPVERPTDAAELDESGPGERAEQDAKAGGAGTTDRRDATHGDKPYLSTLPDGYGSELLVMEWLHFLVGESSVADTMRAIRYYRTVDWISEGVASHLQTMLSGTAAPQQRATPDGGSPSELSVDHHTRSLEFIAELRSLDRGRYVDPVSEGIGAGRHEGREDRGVQR